MDSKPSKLILNMLLGGHYGGTKQPFTYTDGSTGTIFDTELLVYWNGATYGNPSFAIGIGNGTAPFSVNDYALANEVMLSDVPADYVSFNDNGTCYNINVTQSFTVSSDINVTEVGLFIKVDSDPGNSNTQKYLLLARDVLDSPITLYANDTISIQYVLYFPYGSQPFTKQFYGLLLNYFFCLRSLGTPISFKCTDGTSTSRNDFANDYKTGTYSSGDVATEHLYTWLGNGSSISWSFDNYTLLSKIGESPSDTPFSLTYNSTHAILSVTITYSFTSPTTITEVGFVIKDIDIDSTIDHNRKSVLILYFVLDNPVYVESGGTFKFKCEIVLPLAG